MLVLVIVILFIMRLRANTIQDIVFEEGLNNLATHAEEIKRPEKVTYLFGVLSKGSDAADYYTILPGDSFSELSIELLVPAQNEYAQFHPSLVWTDPYAAKMTGGIPPDFPQTLGGRVYKWPEERVAEVTEKLAFSQLWAGPKLLTSLGNESRLFAVYDPEGRGGRYVVKFGQGKEMFSLTNILPNLLPWLRIKLLIY